jgi:unspecific monooxygenase
VINRPHTAEANPWVQLFQWIMQPLDFLDTCSNRYGDCFVARFGHLSPSVFVSHPQAIEQILTAGAKQFDTGQGNWNLRAMLGDNSLLLLDGDRHQRQRQLLMPPFHGERMRAYGQLILHITEHVTARWSIGKPLTVLPDMQEITLQVIFEAVFGLSDSPRSQQLKQALRSFQAFVASRLWFAMSLVPALQHDLGGWSPGGRFNRLKQQIDQLLYAELRERREQLDPTRTDILTLLLSARDDAGEPMHDDELRDELITLLVAGYENTAAALSWALYWIHRLPDVKAKLLAELATLDDPLDPGAIVRLPYLNAVCSETLRIYPVAFIAQLRFAKMPMKLMGYEFETNTKLIPCIYLTHQREDLYPEPKQFKPERFLERQFSPYEYLPFGGSNRRCIGAAFALYEMKLVLAAILQRYHLSLVDAEPIKPIRRGVTTAPKGGIRMVVRNRVELHSVHTAAYSQSQ